MPNNCAVYGCLSDKSKTKGSGIKYFTFPKEKTHRDLWINACGRGDGLNPQYAVVCSLHFQPQDYTDDMKSRLLGIGSRKNMRNLRKDVVPSLFLSNEYLIGTVRVGKGYNDPLQVKMTTTTQGENWDTNSATENYLDYIQEPEAPESVVCGELPKEPTMLTGTEPSQYLTGTVRVCTGYNDPLQMTMTTQGDNWDTNSATENYSDYVQEPEPPESVVCGELPKEPTKLTNQSTDKCLEKRHNCKMCEMAFRRKTQLRRHVLRHTKKRPHVCEVCSKRFPRIDTLKTHSFIHSGEGAYSCKSCRKAFARNFDLQKHLLTHTRVRPYGCKMCLKAFTHKGQLKIHYFVHTKMKTQVCKICGKAFKYPKNMRKHNSIPFNEISLIECLNENAIHSRAKEDSSKDLLPEDDEATGQRLVTINENDIRI